MEPISPVSEEMEKPGSILEPPFSPDKPAWMPILLRVPYISPAGIKKTPGIFRGRARKTRILALLLLLILLGFGVASWKLHPRFAKEQSFAENQNNPCLELRKDLSLEEYGDRKGTPLMPRDVLPEVSEPRQAASEELKKVVESRPPKPVYARLAPYIVPLNKEVLP